MTTITLAGFLSKKQIEKVYGRSFRSLTRDITRAVKAGDSDILQHLKLVTEDEKIREGRDVTPEMIQELSTNGRRPMWLAEEVWVADWVTRQRSGRRYENAEVQSDTRSESQSPTIDLPVPSTPAQSAPVEFLQQRIDDQKQQIEMLRGELKIKNEQIAKANELAEANLKLTGNLQTLLKNVQDGLLGEGSPRLLALGTVSNKPTSQTPQPTVLEAVGESTSVPTTRSTPKPGPRKRNSKRSDSTKPADQPAPDLLHRLFPTFLRSKKRGN